MGINDDIDAIIQRGEERTAELNSKYEGLNLEDLNNFKSDASVQQWEGEDFRPGVCRPRSSLVFSGTYSLVRKKPSTSICKSPATKSRTSSTFHHLALDFFKANARHDHQHLSTIMLESQYLDTIK